MSPSCRTHQWRVAAATSCWTFNVRFGSQQQPGTMKPATPRRTNQWIPAIPLHLRKRKQVRSFWEKSLKLFFKKSNRENKCVYDTLYNLNFKSFNSAFQPASHREPAAHLERHESAAARFPLGRTLWPRSMHFAPTLGNMVHEPWVFSGTHCPPHWNKRLIPWHKFWPRSSCILLDNVFLGDGNLWRFGVQKIA